MRGRSVATRAELLQLKTIGVIPTVLLRDVVPLLALLARERDLRTDIARLGGHSSFLTSSWVVLSHPDSAFAPIGTYAPGWRFRTQWRGRGSNPRPYDYESYALTA